ncbi:MAG: Helix-turn-helix domain [Chloroflexia bacterium]|jgi:excisionase family DNA binding protein|nr:Helix-turn-helix domain [Chloroflexia bacterium]
MSELLDREQAAEFLGVTRPTISNMLRDGRLTASTTLKGKKPLFTKEYLEEVKPTLRIYNVGARAAQQRETATA